MSNYKKELGSFGEEKSCQFLIENGYEILERNYRCSMGEIDIIAIKNDVLVFIEVKTRTSMYYGLPSEAVNLKKQEKYFKTALHYINETGRKNTASRFDIIEILLGRDTESINHIENAFQHIRMKYYL